MKRFALRLTSRLNVWSWLVLFVLSQGLYALMLVWSIPHLQSLAAGLPIFDLRPMGYGPIEAHAFLAALGSEGNSFYQSVQLRLDIFFPPLLCIFLLSTWILLHRLFHGYTRGETPRYGWFFLVLLALPILGFLADWAENLGIMSLLRGPIDPDPAKVLTASICSQIKSWASLLGESSLLIYAIVTAIRAYSRRVVRIRGTSMTASSL